MKASGIIISVKNNHRSEIKVFLTKEGIMIQDTLISWKEIKKECTAIDQDIIDMIDHKFTGNLLEFMRKDDQG